MSRLRLPGCSSTTTGLWETCAPHLHDTMSLNRRGAAWCISRSPQDAANKQLMGSSANPCGSPTRRGWWAASGLRQANGALPRGRPTLLGLFQRFSSNYILWQHSAPGGWGSWAHPPAHTQSLRCRLLHGEERKACTGSWGSCGSRASRGDRWVNQNSTRYQQAVRTGRWDRWGSWAASRRGRTRRTCGHTAPWSGKPPSSRGRSCTRTAPRAP